jgi:outer membrane receptor protein involved in Fe transport
MKKSAKLTLAFYGVGIAVAGSLSAVRVADADAAADQAAQGTITKDSSATAPSSGSTSLEEIVVTAQRRGELLSSVPVAVTAVTANELLAVGVKTTADLSHLVPSFQSAESAQSGAPIFTLRGVGFNTANVSSTAPVGLYVGEVAYAYPLMAAGELFDLERVEVLKGPQGTLYGRNTTGGLIDYVPAAPTNTPEASFTAGGGNYGSADFSGFISGPLSDTLTGRVAFNSENRFDGWQHSVTRDDTLGKLYRNSLRAILDWKPTTNFTLESSFNFWARTGDTQAEQAIASVGAAPAPAVAASIILQPHANWQADWTPSSDQPFSAANGIVRPCDCVNDYFYGWAERATYNLTDHLDVVSLTSYNRLIFNQFEDSAGVQTEELGVANFGHIDSFSEELRAIGTYDQFDWSGGGYYAYDQTAEIIQGFAGQNPTIEFLKGIADSIPNSGYTTAQINNSYRIFGSSGYERTGVASIFGNLNYNIVPTVKLNLGVRYTDDYTHFTGAEYDQNGQEVPIVNVVYPLLLGHALPPLAVNGSQTLNSTDTGFAVADESQNVTNVAWRSALSWTPTDTSLLYASVSRGFKSGVFPVLNASAIGQLAPVAEEKLTDYETGAKLALLDRRLQVDTSIFYYDYRNHQVFGQIPDLIFGTLPAVVNIPKSEIYGADWNLRYAITPTLHMTLAGSVLRTQINEFVGSDPFGTFYDYRDAQLPYAPKFSGFTSITKDLALNDQYGAEIGVHASYQSVSNGYVGSEPQFQIDPYALFGASLSLYGSDKDKWKITAYGENLGDKYYWTSAQISHDTIVRLTGFPLTFGVRGTWNF